MFMGIGSDCSAPPSPAIAITQDSGIHLHVAYTLANSARNALITVL